MKHIMIVSLCICMTACASGGFPDTEGNFNVNNGRQLPIGQAPFGPRPGEYIRPQHLDPELTVSLSPSDDCGARMFQNLVGQHEGAIYFAALPGQKRVLKPATLEDFALDRERIVGVDPEPLLIEVREFLPGQLLFAPSIRTTPDVIDRAPALAERLTIELDEEGIVEDIRCG